MKLIKISMNLFIDEDDPLCDSNEGICRYLTQKLYTDPEFFGEFESNNIVSIEDYND